MRRLENDIIFEEMNQWACTEQFADCMIGNMAAVVLEIQGMLKFSHSILCVGQYWLYHKFQIEDDDEEKL